MPGSHPFLQVVGVIAHIVGIYNTESVPCLKRSITTIILSLSFRIQMFHSSSKLIDKILNRDPILQEHSAKPDLERERIGLLFRKLAPPLPLTTGI